MSADLVLLNGKIVTVDKEDSIVEAVAVKFGRILSVGSSEQIKSYIGEQTKIIDLKNRVVLPGLIDSHCHMVAMGSRRMVSVDLSEEAGVRSITDIQKKLANRAKITPKGDWIFGAWEDDSKLREKRHPTRWELDEASLDHPILISTVGGHFEIVNSKAFEMAGVTRDTPDPVGGLFERDPKTGELTGGLHEKAVDVVLPGGPYEYEPSREVAYEGAKKMLLECAAAGLTCIHDSIRAPQIRAINDLVKSGDLPIRVRMDIWHELLPELKKLGISQGFGGPWARIIGVKFLFDGAISARTAAVSQPYLNRSDFYGVMATTKDIATKEIMNAYQSGYRIATHVNGDRAISMFLDIMEEAQNKYPRKAPRNRAIHCTVVNPKLVRRIKNLGILPTIFGPYPYYHGDKLIPAFGEDRLEWMFTARSFLDSDIKVSAHSDHSAGPMPPMIGIHALVNRKTKSGKPIGQSQRISVMEAIRLYTINAAYHAFDENDLGSIEPGKLADMVILGGDILEIPTEKIIEIPIDMTIIDGKVVYKREGHTDKF